jgi:LDH2 family malate/lactate/ureidoglycolate dehydrogenase
VTNQGDRFFGAGGAVGQTVPLPRLRQQVEALLLAWGMRDEYRAGCAEKILWADAHGIDSHGVTMLPLYAEQAKQGRIAMPAVVSVERERPATAVVNGGGGLGHPAMNRACDLAITKARAGGVASIAVRHSNHFGAAGAYGDAIARAGLIGFVCTAAFKATLVPTFATAPAFGTNPLAFAAPVAGKAPFLLDMATSTVAVGKLKLAAMAGKRMPAGWALDPSGRSLSDAVEALKYRLMTPLGGNRELGSHKGYGLAAMVEILSTVVGGARFAAWQPSAGDTYDVGHFVFALDPAAFRPAGEFETEMARLVDYLHALPRSDPAQPVLVAGDTEFACAELRARQGVPLLPDQVAILRGLSADAGVACLI